MNDENNELPFADDDPPVVERGNGLHGLGELERDLGVGAEEVRYLDEGDLSDLQGDGWDHETGSRREPDLTRPGKIPRPDDEPLYPYPEVDYYFRNDDGRWEIWRDADDEQIECGKLWILKSSGIRQVESCESADYQAYYRETLLRGLAEAHRQCAPTRCEKVLAWVYSADWGCYEKGQHCRIRLAILCTAI